MRPSHAPRRAAVRRTAPARAPSEHHERRPPGARCDCVPRVSLDEQRPDPHRREPRGQVLGDPLQQFGVPGAPPQGVLGEVGEPGPGQHGHLPRPQHRQSAVQPDGLADGDRDGAFVVRFLDGQHHVAVDRVRPLGDDHRRHGGPDRHACRVATGGRTPPAPERADDQEVAPVRLLDQGGGERPRVPVHLDGDPGQGGAGGLGQTVGDRSGSLDRRVRTDDPDPLDAVARTRHDPPQGLVVRHRGVRGQRHRRPSFVHPDRPPPSQVLRGRHTALRAPHGTPGAGRGTGGGPGHVGWCAARRR